MIILLCNNCQTENEVKFVEDIIECGNCGQELSKENAGGIFER